jgi:hypothetical protein
MSPNRLKDCRRPKKRGSAENGRFPSISRQRVFDCKTGGKPNFGRCKPRPAAHASGPRALGTHLAAASHELGNLYIWNKCTGRRGTRRTSVAHERVKLTLHHDVFAQPRVATRHESNLQDFVQQLQREQSA